MMAELLWAEMRLTIDKAKECVNHFGDFEETEVAVEGRQKFCVERSSSQVVLRIYARFIRATEGRPRKPYLPRRREDPL